MPLDLLEFVFQPLNEPAIRRLVDLEVAKLAERRGIRRHQLTLVLTDEWAEYLATKGFSARFGARELKRVIESTLCRVAGETIASADLPAEIKDGARSSDVPLPEGETYAERMAAVEKALLLEALGESDWSQKEAAEALEMTVTEFRKLYRRHKLAELKP